jgi:hypothetical protein
MPPETLRIVHIFYEFCRSSGHRGPIILSELTNLSDQIENLER